MRRRRTYCYNKKFIPCIKRLKHAVTVWSPSHSHGPPLEGKRRIDLKKKKNCLEYKVQQICNKYAPKLLLDLGGGYCKITSYEGRRGGDMYREWYVYIRSLVYWTAN